MRDTLKRNDRDEALEKDTTGTDPNAGIPASSPGGGLVEPGKTDLGSAPLGSGSAHADLSPEEEMYGGPRAIDYDTASDDPNS